MDFVISYNFARKSNAVNRRAH